MSDERVFDLAQGAPPRAGKIRLNTEYGAPEDYAKAVEELCAALPAEKWRRWKAPARSAAAAEGGGVAETESS